MKIINRFKVGLAASLMILATVSYAESNVATDAVSAVKDVAITAMLDTQIAMDKTFSHSNFDLKTHDGLVTMSGVVHSQAELDALTELAKSTAGVKGVDTAKLTVQTSNQPITDFVITTKIESRIFKNRMFANKNEAVTTIKVETKNGVVYLSGYAENDAQVDNAITLAKTTDGVVRVVSFVKVPN